VRRGARCAATARHTPAPEGALDVRGVELDAPPPPTTPLAPPPPAAPLAPEERSGDEVVAEGAERGEADGGAGE